MVARIRRRIDTKAWKHSDRCPLFSFAGRSMLFVVHARLGNCIPNVCRGAPAPTSKRRRRQRLSWSRNASSGWLDAWSRNILRLPRLQHASGQVWLSLLTITGWACANHASTNLHCWPKIGDSATGSSDLLGHYCRGFRRGSIERNASEHSIMRDSKETPQSNIGKSPFTTTDLTQYHIWRLES